MSKESPDGTIRRLIEARLWTLEHRSILSLTHPPLPIDPVADPIAHLFTEQPKSAAALAYTGAPDTPFLKLHLLKTVTVAGQTVELHEELN